MEVAGKLQKRQAGRLNAALRSLDAPIVLCDARDRIVLGNAAARQLGLAPEETSLSPAPDGLLKIQREHPGIDLVFLGDTIDDARSARLAGVPFYGVAKRDHLRRAELLRLFEAEQAVGVIENVNEIGALV